MLWRKSVTTETARQTTIAIYHQTAIVMPVVDSIMGYGVALFERRPRWRGDDGEPRPPMTPCLRSEPTTHRLAIRVTRTEYLAVKHLARRHQLTISALIGEAVAEFASDCGEGQLISRRCCLGALCAHHRACSTPERR